MVRRFALCAICKRIRIVISFFNVVSLLRFGKEHVRGCSLIISDDWDILLSSFIAIAGSKKAEHIIAKLVLAASAYLVWQERNNRIFKNQQRSVQQLIDYIVATIRLKLLSCQFKRTQRIDQILDTWKLPSTI